MFNGSRFGDTQDSLVSLVVDLLKQNNIGGVDESIMSGDWIIFPNVSNTYYQNFFRSWGYDGSVRLRVAVNLGKTWETIQGMRQRGEDEYGFTCSGTSADDQGKRAVRHFYDYTIWEAVGTLNIRLDLYATDKEYLERLNGYDLLIPDHADFEVRGGFFKGFEFVDKLLEEAG